MSNTTQTTATATKQKQHVVAVSESAKAFIAKLTGEFAAPSKSKDLLNASEREIVDAMVDFVEGFRFESVEETDEHGNAALVTVDRFAQSIGDIMALRMEITRTNSAAVKVSALEAEREELLAQIALLKAQAGA